MKLSQSRGFLRIESEILADGVHYRERGVLTSHETKIPFEQISDELVRTFHVPRLYVFISLFFGLAFAYRAYRFATTDQVSVASLIWSAILFAMPTLGTWMQSPRYVGYLSSRGGVLFFDKRGKEDPTEFLRAVDVAKAVYLRRYAESPSSAKVRDNDPGRFPVH